MATLLYKFGKIIGKNDFPYHFKKTIVRYKKISYQIDVLRQTACLIQSMLKTVLTALIADGRSGLILNDGTILNLTYE